MTKSPINYKQRRENELYWLARAAEHSDIYLADAEKVADTLGLAYFNAFKQLEKAAQNVFKNFQTAFNLSETEARQLLEKYYGEKPSQAIAKAVNDITDEEEKFRLQTEMSAPAYQYRIKRLDTLASEGKKLCETLYKVEVATNTAFLAAEYEKAYNLCTFDIQKGTGVSVAFEHVPKSRIDQVLKTNWSGKHFSTRVWDNTQELAQELSHVMAESFMTGESGYKTAQKIQERFGVGAYNARRLIRTENTYITGQAELESYEKSKIKEYKYAALMDERTSKICRELDGKIFSLSEAQAGKNYPPMHPFCRSSSIPIIPTYEELVAREKKILEQIPDDMTFDEWLDSLEPTEDGMLEFKPKNKGKSVDISGESGIINKKVSDRIINIHNETDNVFDFVDIENEMMSSPVGKDIAIYIENEGISITVNYDLNVADGLCGEILGKEVTVYGANHRSVKEVVDTIVHEVAHRKYNWNSTQEDEINCRILEILRTKDSISETEISRIVDFVRENYSDIPEGELYGY